MEANGNTHSIVDAIKRAALEAADTRAAARAPLPGLPAAPAAPEIGTHVEIDPRKLGNEGHRMLGEAAGLERWGLMFAAYADKTLDLRERATLREVAKALQADAERIKTQLAQFAYRRGAATLAPGDAPALGAPDPLRDGWVLPDGCKAEDYGRLPSNVGCRCPNLIDTGSGLYCCKLGAARG